MSVKQYIESKYFRVVAIVGGVFLVALLSFAVGVRVGLHKALFSTHFGQNYERNFMGGPGGRGGAMIPPFGKMIDANDRGVRNPHGVGGEIISISGDTLVIKDRNNQESSVRISEATSINRGKEILALEHLGVGDRIIVVGKPGDDGVIIAGLVRVFDVLNR